MGSSLLPDQCDPPTQLQDGGIFGNCSMPFADSSSFASHVIMTHFILVPLMMAAMIHVLPKMMPITIKIPPFILAPWMTVATICVLPKMMTILMINHLLLKV
jgi:hypothetical protein